MSTKQILSGAVQADVNVCNSYEPARAGAQGMQGTQIAIPVDYVARVNAGQEVPGCTYAHLEEDGSLYITATVQAASVGPSALTSLPVGLRSQLAPLLAKIAAAQVVP